MKLKLLLLFVMVGVFAHAQNDTIKTLIISEAHLGNIQRNYVEITNMGTETVDLSMFEIGATRTNNFPGSGWRFPEGFMLDPGESYFIGVYHDFVASRAKFMTPETYTEQPPTEFEQAQDYQVHVEDYDFVNNPTGILGNVSVWIPFDSIGIVNDPPIRTYFMRDCIFLEQHFPSGDSAVVDQVGGTFTEDTNEDGILENFYPGTDQGSLAVAGYENAGSFANLVRKFSVKQGNTEFIVGNSEDDSEWLTVENLTHNDYRKSPWTFGNHGDYNLDANTLQPMAGSGITVDFPGKIIHVPWGTYRPDGIMAQMEYTPGVAWFPVYYTADDSTSWQYKTGDSLQIVVLGNDADRATFRIEVEEPAASENRVTPMLNERIDYGSTGVLYTPTAAELEGYMFYLSKSVEAYAIWVTDGAPTMDTITGPGSSIINRGIAAGTRIDTLLERLEKAPMASWEIVPVDGNTARPDLMNGDILKVTAEDGSEKEYFIKMAVDVGNNNARLSSITWPDVPDPELFELLYGWQGDTIPGFGPTTPLYQLKLPPEVKSIPATVAKPSNVNAKVEVQRATFLQGTQEERTTTYTVTATDDTTVMKYSVEWQPEPDPEYLQPYEADPFFSQYIERWYFSDHFLEIANPGNQILDLSNYMIVAYTGGTTPPEAIINAGNVEDYGYRFKKYIPGYVWADETDWAIEENRFIARPDPAVNALVKPGDVFCLGDNARVSGWGYGTTGWSAEDFPGSPSGVSIYGQVDVNFQIDWGNPWGIPVSRYQTCVALAARGDYQYLFKILNDSIKLGLKAATDPNDFELIDVIGMVDGSRWLWGFPKIPTYYSGSKVERKPEIVTGNPELEASFGSGDPVGTGEFDETTEWIYTDGASPNRAPGPWPNNRIATAFLGFGSHYFIPYTGYISTVSARIYKVSPGYSNNELIRGLITGVTVSGFYDALTKKDEGQTLMIKSSADGSELGMDELIANGDTLVVVSADETNTTKYVLEVTEEGLNSDAVLTSERYDIKISVEPTKSAGEDGVGTITGFEYGTQLRTILANVTVPEGATLSMVNDEDDFVTLKRLNFDTVYVDVTVNSGTYFEVVAEDGVTTINYQLMPQSSSDAAFITSDYFNVVQSDKLVEYVPGGISVSSLLAKLVPSTGATMMVVDKSGLERTMGSIARDDEVVVTSASGNVTSSYFIQVITSASPDGPGLGYYLAYITSNFYMIDQVNNMIHVDNSAGAVSITEFAGRLTAHTDGATLEVIDDNGDGVLNDADMVKVTARDGRFSAMYSVDLAVSSRMVRNNISLYPNPTTGRINVSGLEVGGRVQVFNYTGAAIRDFRVNSNVETLSLSDQPAGMYLIRISDANANPVGRYKLMKR